MLFKHIVLGKLSNVLIASLAIAFSYRALAMDVWTFHGACKDSTIKQGSSHVDNQDSAISCDAGYIMELGNRRKLVQFGLKQSELVPPGFAGGAFKYLDGHYALVLDTVYPQRVIAGKTTEQIYSETMKTAMPTEGYCFHDDGGIVVIAIGGAPDRLKLVIVEHTRARLLRRTIAAGGRIGID